MKVKRILATVALSAILASPMVALAVAWPDEPQAGGAGGVPITLQGLLDIILIPVWMIFAFIVLVTFIYAGVMFVTAAGNPDKIALAKSAAINGVVGIVVAIVAWVVLAVATAILTT